MSDLLTRDEYAAIAADMTYPAAAFIDGKFRAGSGDKFPTINPATGKKIATISGCNAKDVNLAVKKARKAFEEGHWAKLHPSERKDADKALQTDHPKSPRTGCDGVSRQWQADPRLRAD